MAEEQESEPKRAERPEEGLGVREREGSWLRGVRRGNPGSRRVFQAQLVLRTDADKRPITCCPAMSESGQAPKLRLQLSHLSGDSSRIPWPIWKLGLAQPLVSALSFFTPWSSDHHHRRVLHGQHPTAAPKATWSPVSLQGRHLPNPGTHFDLHVRQLLAQANSHHQTQTCVEMVRTGGGRPGRGGQGHAPCSVPWIIRASLCSIL